MDNVGCDIVEAAAIKPAVRKISEGFEVTGPILVTSRSDIASILRAHRIAKGWTCEEFDARAGWSDRYVTKAEHCYRARIEVTPPTTDDPDEPSYGGDVPMSFMSEIWLETAGLALVLLPADLAKAIGAVPAPAKGVGR